MKNLKKYAAKKAFDGFIFGTVAAIMFAGIFAFVLAVAPGTVTNPAFGPQDDDVALPTPSVWPMKFCKASEVVSVVFPVPPGFSFADCFWIGGISHQTSPAFEQRLCVNEDGTWFVVPNPTDPSAPNCGWFD